MTPRHLLLAGVALFTALPAFIFGAASLQPGNLRCEYRRNPLGIDTQKPRLAWTMTARDAAAKNLKQTAYRVLAASTEASLQAGKGDLWDSGKIASDQSIQVEYAGRPLRSGEPVYWKVQVWDQNGEASNWSEPAMWSMGLLQASDWKGKWIGLDESNPAKPQGNSLSWLQQAKWIWSSPTDTPKTKRYFRAAVDVPASAKLVRATYVLAAESSFVLFVNGNRAGRGNMVQLPEVLDVTPWIKNGSNAIRLEVTGANSVSKPSGVIGALHIETTAGSVDLTTGSNWQVAEDADGSAVEATVLGSYGMQPWGETGYSELRVLPARYLRKEFPVESRVRHATAYITGLGLSELYVNGTKISDDVLSPALTAYEQRAPYVTYDVTKQLKNGTNAVGVILGNGRYWAPRLTVPTKTVTYGSPKLRMQITVEYENGKSSTLATDESWKLTTNGPIRANNEYDGEEYDARREMPGWADAGFREDGTWKAAQVVAAPSPVISAAPSEPVRVMETLKPLSVKQIHPGVYIFDMGQNMVGWCRLTVQGPKGTRVSLRHSEILRPDGSLYMDNLRSSRVQDFYTLKGSGTEVWEPRFTYHGFRYVEVTGYPGEPKLTALQGRVVHDALPNAGEFVTSNSLLNQIHKNIYWGTRGNYRSIPTDCPQRDERQGWLGDRAVESRGEMYLFDAGPLYAKFMTDIADSQKPSGSVSDVAPAYWPLYNDSVTWPGSFIIFPQALYELYGDRRVIERNYPAMKKWMDYMAGFMKDGVMPKDTYGDWCVPPERLELIHSQDPLRKTEPAVLGSTYYHYALQLMSGYARLLGREDDARHWSSMATALRSAFNAKFFNPAKGNYSNGSQTSSILPLFFDMVPKENRSAIFGSLVRKIEGETGGHVGTGLVGGQWLMRTLSDNGRADLAFRIANQKSYPSWGYMIDKGATTIWELWNGDTADPAMNSGNHVMLVGDLNIWFYEYLAGIRPDPANPAFHHTIIKPTVMPDLQFVRASHRSLYGEIRSEWKREGKEVILTVTIPPNTTASVHVPGGSVTDVGSGTHVFRTKGN